MTDQTTVSSPFPEDPSDETFDVAFDAQFLPSEWVFDISEMHTKFGVNDVIRKLPADKLAVFLQFRLDFLQEELNEAKAAAVKLSELAALGKFDRVEDNERYAAEKEAVITAADDVVDAMIDLCVVAIGTLDAFDVDADEAWTRVFEANMQKEPGIKASRPNPLGLPDLIKPTGWVSPQHRDNTGFITRIAGVEV